MSNNDKKTVDKPTNPWDDNKYWTYPGSDELFEMFKDRWWSVEDFGFWRDGDQVKMEWRNHSDRNKEERAKFLNKLVADGWKFVSILSEVPSVLTIVVSR
jgi:hypothetical protein